MRIASTLIMDTTVPVGVAIQGMELCVTVCYPQHLTVYMYESSVV